LTASPAPADPMPALDDALAKALRSVGSASDLLSSGAGMQLYKTVLLCRLEVQYAIVLLRLTYGLAARPPPARGTGPERALCHVTEHLLGARELFGKGDLEGTLGALLCADSALARLIMRLRREKHPVSGGIGTARTAKKKAGSMGEDVGEKSEEREEREEMK